MSVRVEICDPSEPINRNRTTQRTVFLRIVASGRGVFAVPPMSFEEALSVAEQLATKVRELAR